MGYIAKGTITLNTVNDAYTVSLTKSSCVIKADFDGTNPQLSDAQTVITVCRGDKSMAFNCTLAEEFSSYASVTSSDERQKYVLKINNLPSDELEGSISVTVTTDDGFTTDIQFGYSVVRESTMLDWIKDWEGGKTKIGNTYVMTPKIFIGKKAQYAEYSTNGTNAKEDIMAVPGLTGVYIGPDSDSTGIYGYKNSVEIFHLNNKGGSIGGWNIEQSDIYSKNGQMYISSTGSIYAQDSNGKHIWELNEDGSAKFACGNVVFDANGNAQFTGKITSSSGSIGGWTITSNQIHSDNLVLNKKEQVIGIIRSGVCISTDQNGNQEIESLNSITHAGGVGFYYSSDTDWGLIGRVANTAWQTTDASIAFKLGSSNSIAGWSFDEDALWFGTKNNTVNNFTTAGITIGSTGLRSTKWRFEKDGSGALAGGNLVWDKNGNLSIKSRVTAASGEKVWSPVYLGEWQEGKTYGYYDQVDHEGTLWLCIAPEGTEVTEEPQESSAYWRAVTAIVPVEMKISRDFDGFRYGTVGNIQCSVFRGVTDLTGCVTTWKVSRDSGSVLDDTAWGLSDKAKNFDGSIRLACNAQENDFGSGDTVTFTFTAIGDTKLLATRSLMFV